jgi:hypothetical protein
VALQKQPFRIQFAGGVDTKTNPKGVIPAKLTALENATFVKNTSLAKRNGYRALSKRIGDGSSEYTGAVGLTARDDELILCNVDRAYSYRPTADRWHDTGEVCSVVATDIAFARSGTQQRMPDHATNSGITVGAWEDSRGGVYAAVQDADSGHILVEQQVDPNGFMPRVIACGTVLLLFWLNSTDTYIWCAVINPSNPTDTITGTILADDRFDSYDVCTAGGNVYASNPGLLAYGSTSGGIRVAYVHQSGVIGSPLTGLPSAYNWTLTNTAGSGGATLVGPIAVTFDKVNHTAIAVTWGTVLINTLFLTYTDLTSKLYGGTVYAGASQFKRVCAEFDASSQLWYAGELAHDSHVDHNQTVCGAVNTSGTAIATPTTRRLHGHGIASRAFYDAGKVYCAVVHPVIFFPYVAIVRMSSAEFGGAYTMTASRLLPGVTAGLSSRDYSLPAVQPVDPDASFLSRQHSLALGYRIQLSSTNGDQFSEEGIKITTLDFLHDSAYSFVQLGAGLYLAGSLLAHYDGMRWAESDFHCAPDFATSTPGTDLMTSSAGGGSMSGSKTYGYRFCYEEVDAQGEVHSGAMSQLYNIVMGASDNTVTLTIPTYRLTMKNNVRISVFRSAGNATGTVETIEFFRVTDTDPSVLVGANCYLPNDPTVDAVTFVDELADAGLTTREPAYTNGGILSNDPIAISGSVVAGGKYRIFYTHPSDPDLVYFSKSLKDDTAAEFSPALFVRCDPYGGAVVGIGVQDETIMPFKEHAIYAFGGPGPDDDGGLLNPNDQFSNPELVTSDVGCLTPNSIAQSPQGLVFQTDKGIPGLIDRSRQIQMIGNDVYGYKDQTLQRATLLPGRHQILFLTDTADGMSLLWDYERGQWGPYSNHVGVDAIVVAGTYYYLRDDGRVFAETPGVYADDTSHVKMRITTAWLTMTGYNQGWQKILRANFLGDWKSDHVLRVYFALDYEEQWVGPFDLDVNSDYNPDLYGAGLYGADGYSYTPGTNSTLYQKSLHINRRCQAIRFRIEDVESASDFGAAFELQELLLIGGVLGPARPVGASRQA